jgi:DNA-binding response OmpR family regulator
MSEVQLLVKPFAPRELLSRVRRILEPAVPVRTMGAT